MIGWGASCGSTSTGGLWTKEERRSHINYLELLATFLALKTFAIELKSSKILQRLDNITAISFINRMGGTHSSQLSNLAVEIWKWYLRRDLEGSTSSFQLQEDLPFNFGASNHLSLSHGEIPNLLLCSLFLGDVLHVL